MLGFCNNSKNIALLALAGFGLYAQCNDLNIANNTTMLLAFFFLILEHEELTNVKHDIECIEEHGCRRHRFEQRRLNDTGNCNKNCFNIGNFC